MRKPVERTGRIAFLDAVRGATIISMVAFHAAYDLAYLFAVPLPWFTNGCVQGLWRISISWTFIVLAGWMTAHARSNARRALRYGIVAFAVWAVTSIVAVDTPISFGIIFCMAASTALYALLARLVPSSWHRWAAIAVLAALVLFLATYRIPQARYGVEGLAWLGFPSASFSSGDYYPLVPFGFLYLASACAAHAWLRRGGTYPAWMRRSRLHVLEALGRHSLLIYLLHQPLVLAVCTVLFG